MVWGTLSILVWALAAEPAPPAFLRGDFLAMKGSDKIGEFGVRTAENQVYRCQFDDRTWFESNKLRINASALQSGDHLEVVSDRSKPSPGGCYARTVHVIEILTPVRSRLRPYQSVTEHIAPRGDLTYAGVILAVNTSRLELRLRNQTEPVSLLLRPDTRYVQDGVQIESGQLKRNMRVYVRAGKNLEEHVEAYQISWGEILNPMKP